MSRFDDDEKHPLVTILLLNYNGADDTLSCLESLKKLDYPNYKIIVVDNASEKKDVNKIRRSNVDFQLIESDENLGYSGGNNLGIRYVLEREKEGKYLWLLNNDTTVDPAALTHLVNTAQKTGGLVGSLILYPDKSYQQVGTRINWTTGAVRGYHESELEDGMEIECLSGASMLVPLTVFRRIGLLEESYFLYFEDAEFCLRADDEHIPINLTLRSRVYHKEGATTGKKSRMTQYYYQRNRLKLLYDYAPPGNKWLIFLYSYFRMLRSWLKSLTGNPDRKTSAKIHMLALKDHLNGVEGSCPHQLTQL